MADTKTTDETAVSAPALTDLVRIVQSGANFKATIAQFLAAMQGDGLDPLSAGFREIPLREVSAAATTVASDAGGGLVHPAADTSGRAWTIADNATVAYPIGTAITFCNENGAGVITLSIAGTDTMRQTGTGATGPFLLAPDGQATALKIKSTKWQLGGAGLSV